MNRLIMNTRHKLEGYLAASEFLADMVARRRLSHEPLGIRRIAVGSGNQICCPSIVYRLPDAVGTTITDRPPHRTVRARLRIRLPPWMSSEEAFERIRMQNAGCWNPVLKDRSQPIPQCAASLTAAAQDQPPQ